MNDGLNGLEVFWLQIVEMNIGILAITVSFIKYFFDFTLSIKSSEGYKGL